MKIEFDVTMSRIITGSTVAGIAASVLFWIFQANASHEQTKKNTGAIDILSRRELQKEAVWGKDYWMRSIEDFTEEKKR